MSTKDSDTAELYKTGFSKFSWNDIFQRKTLALILSPLVVAILGSASRGDIFLYMAMAWANWDKILPSQNPTDQNDTLFSNETSENQVEMSPLDSFLHEYQLDNVYYVIPAAITVSFSLFFSVGGFLQWHYYIQRRDRPEEWKCQPTKFLSKKDERHEILFGMSNLVLGSTVSAILSTIVINGGRVSTLYYDVSEYGIPYLILSTIAIFLCQDAASYYIHRALHFPFFYRHFHKLHHRYHSPTAFSAVAMHPAEFLVLQMALAMPMFLFPCYYLAFLFCVFYDYYYGMIDHSGIDLEAIWPWQPPVRFHDDHHKYFHVNFGFNTMLFDRFHDTLRKKSRKYSETLFWGRGVEKTKNGVKKLE